MLKKSLLPALLLLLLAGCSGHATSMQEVTSFCRSVVTEELCTTQDSVCAEYSEVVLAPYESAKECRRSCERVREKMNLNMEQQECLSLIQNVEGKCTEFCNSNYK